LRDPKFGHVSDDANRDIGGYDAVRGAAGASVLNAEMMLKSRAIVSGRSKPAQPGDQLN